MIYEHKYAKDIDTTLSPTTEELLLINKTTNAGLTVPIKDVLKAYWYGLNTISIEYVNATTIKLLADGAILSSDKTVLHTISSDMLVTMTSHLADTQELANTTYYIWLGYINNTFVGRLSASNSVAPTGMTKSVCLPYAILNNYDKNLMAFSSPCTQLSSRQTLTSLSAPERLRVTKFADGQTTQNYVASILSTGSLLVTGNGTSNVCGNNSQIGGYFSQIVKKFQAPIKKVCVGYYNMLILLTDGTVWTTGNNSYGQRGLGHTTEIGHETQVPGLTAITDIYMSQSSYCSCYAYNGSQLWSWGSNGASEIGDGTVTNRTSPYQVLTSIASVTLLNNESYTTVFAMMHDGTVKVWGRNDVGQCGLGHVNAVTIPTTNTNLANLVSLHPCHALCDGTIGYGSMFAVKSNGVYGWGGNANYNLGLGIATVVSTPTKVVALSATPIQITGVANSYSYFLMSDNTVKVVGLGSWGTLGTGNTSNLTTITSNALLTNVVRIIPTTCVAVAVNCTFFLTTSGLVYACGHENSAQTGSTNGNNSVLSTPKLIPGLFNITDVVAYGIPSADANYFGHHCLAMDTTGNVYFWGSGKKGECSCGDRAIHITFPPQQLIL